MERRRVKLPCPRRATGWLVSQQHRLSKRGDFCVELLCLNEHCANQIANFLHPVFVLHS